MYKLLSLITIILFTLVACSSQKKLAVIQLKQGISGMVSEEFGNRMPMVDAPVAVPNPMVTTVFVYDVVQVKDVEPANFNGMYAVVKSKLIASVKTDDKGKFSIELPVGKYSLFVQKNKSFYANIFNTQNEINVFEVVKDSVTNANIKVTVDAVY
ncbi:MAG: hypothetical protein ACOVNY_06560 [Chitinophagaceae bacterium]